MLFGKRKKTIITLGIGQAARGTEPPATHPVVTPEPEPMSIPPEPVPPPHAEAPLAPPEAIAETPPPVTAAVTTVQAEPRPSPPRRDEPSEVAAVKPAPPAAARPEAAPPAAPAEIKPEAAEAPKLVETAAPPASAAETSVVRIAISPQPIPEAPAAEFEIVGEEVPGEEAGFVQCPFCLNNSRVGMTHCESCGNLIESTRPQAEPEPEPMVPEPEAPAAPVPDLVERPDQADTHRLAHHPVPQILKETTLFTPAILRLQPEQGQTGEKEYSLNIGDSTIGRGIDNTLPFPDEEFISRHHCSIGYHKYQYVLKDLDSANGTYVNDVRIRETILRDGDCVQIGSMRFIFDDPMERIKKKKAAAGDD